MPVLKHKNGFKTGITVARIDFTHENKPHSHSNHILEHDCQSNQLEPTEQLPPLNPTKFQEPRKYQNDRGVHKNR
ncbi:hypothetical protein HMPREF3214_00700 [Alloscardovia omnicolens]|nr:hypothetical protein HMPREF3214_00700 [Alloscardovia omnicolens]